jgi:hypothetical protein
MLHRLRRLAAEALALGDLGALIPATARLVALRLQRLEEISVAATETMLHRLRRLAAEALALGDLGALIPATAHLTAPRLRGLEDITEVTAEAEALLPRRLPTEALSLCHLRAFIPATAHLAASRLRRLEEVPVPTAKAGGPLFWGARWPTVLLQLRPVLGPETADLPALCPRRREDVPVGAAPAILLLRGLLLATRLIRVLAPIEPLAFEYPALRQCLVGHPTVVAAPHPGRLDLLRFVARVPSSAAPPPRLGQVREELPIDEVAVAPVIRDQLAVGATPPLLGLLLFLSRLSLGDRRDSPYRRQTDHRETPAEATGGEIHDETS